VKIAIVHQPIGGIVQPGVHADSITILVYEIARRLAGSAETVVYDRLGPGQEERETLDGVQYRRLSPQADDGRLLPYLRRHLSRFARWGDPRRPPISSKRYHRSYIERIARDLRQHPCDFVVVETLLQYPSVIRTFNPTTRIALHMHCEWLNQFDRRMVSRWLEPVDLILGVSDYITNRVRVAQPEHAEKCRTLLNGCDVNRFQSTPLNNLGPKRLLFLARVSPEK
jgi:glycosyltransferase involved in cell wall biosynthesis